MIKPHAYSKKYDESSSSSNGSNTDSTIVASAYGLPLPSNEDVNVRLNQIDDMKLFFATATHNWDSSKPVKKFPLPGGENVACVLWKDLFFISGTDIVRSLSFRFHAFGRPVTNAKKFEEGIFSDLRNLKPGHDARLEEPKSELLDMLYKNTCIRTQKKQKVFYWFSVPHDRLFLDALERDLKREKMGMEPTTKAVAEPATSISLDSAQELFNQMRRQMSQSILSDLKKDEQKRTSKHSPKLKASTLLNSKAANHKLFVEDHTSNWSPTQSRLERAAAQAKRARVNSVPANLGKQQQSQLLHQQRYHRLSHGSYFTGKPLPSSSVTRLRSGRVIPSASTSSLLSTATPSSSTTSLNDSFQDDLSHCSGTTALTDISKPTSMLSCRNPQQQPDYMESISEGVNDLDITTSISNNTISSFDQQQQQQVSPSKSVDPNSLKKPKTIFGSLSLFDGSPSYKQRRRRATSVSMSAQNNSTKPMQSLYSPAGRPERLRRYQPQQPEMRTATTPATPVVTLPQLSHSLSNMNSHSTSRLAMAAAKAGFVSGSQLMATAPSSSPTTFMPVMSTSISHPLHSDWASGSQPYFPQQQQQAYQDLYCPVTNCRHPFKGSDQLERHMQAVHMSVVCALCGKQFPQSNILAQHHRLEHEMQQYDYTPPTSSFTNDNDGDSSPDINRPYPRGLLHSASIANHNSSSIYSNTNQPYLNYQQASQQTAQGGHGQGDNIYSTHQPSFNSARSPTSVLTPADIAPAAAAMAVAASANAASTDSTCSTLSPMLDVDYDMSDIEQSQLPQQPQPQLRSTSTTPLAASNPPFMAMAPSVSTTAVLMNNENNHIMNSTLFSAINTSSAPPMSTSRSSSISSTHMLLKRNINSSSSPMDDDLTSSSASSPSSTFQFGGANKSNVCTIKKNDPFNASSKSIAPLTLLSPFKPEQYRQMNVQSEEDEDVQHYHDQHQAQQQPRSSDLAFFGSATSFQSTNFMMNAYQTAQQQQHHYSMTQPIFCDSTLSMTTTTNNHFDNNQSITTATTTVAPTSFLSENSSLYGHYAEQQQPQQHYSTPFLGLADMDTLVFGA